MAIFLHEYSDEYQHLFPNQAEDNKHENFLAHSFKIKIFQDRAILSHVFFVPLQNFVVVFLRQI